MAQVGRSVWLLYNHIMSSQSGGLYLPPLWPGHSEVCGSRIISMLPVSDLRPLHAQFRNLARYIVYIVVHACVPLTLLLPRQCRQAWLVWSLLAGRVTGHQRTATPSTTGWLARCLWAGSWSTLTTTSWWSWWTLLTQQRITMYTSSSSW